MTKKDKNAVPAEDQQENAAQETQDEQDTVHTQQPEPTEAEKLQKQLDEEHDARLRLAAEYDNFRKRSQKEREGLYNDIKAETVGKFLPVYDNLQRALENETADTAYKKGVEMTMTELLKILKALGVEEYGKVGEPFNPQMHNAVLHVEDDTVDESVIAEVFQRGFRVGEKVIRFAMVKVAN